MTRQILSVIIAVLVAAAVGAESPSALRPEQRGELYKKNRVVIEGLVKKTIESSNSANDHLKRADTYHDVLLAFNRQIVAARGANDTDRVAELSGHLTTLVDKGLAPTLDKAKRQVEGGSSEGEFPRVKQGLVAQLEVLTKLLADEPAARASLEGATDKVNSITIPEKK